eukprot:9724352-Alexandrium_andersonii.AAC.1
MTGESAGGCAQETAPHGSKRVGAATDLLLHNRRWPRRCTVGTFKGKQASRPASGQASEAKRSAVARANAEPWRNLNAY